MLLASLVLLILTVLGVSFICSLTEAVLLTLNPLSLKLQQTRGAKGADTWLGYKNRIERPIAALLVFNCVANTGLATLVGALFVRQFGSEFLWLFSIGLTLALLFGSEMAPKIIGVHHAERLASPLLRPLQWMLRCAHPLVLLMERFSRKFKPKSPSVKQNGDHIMDILTLVEAARSEQAIHSREEIIIIHAATLSARRTRTAMVPADAVKTFDLRKSLFENVRDLGPKLHRSYPVSRDGSFAGIEGYVRVRDLFVADLLAEGGGKADWHPHIRPLIEVDGGSSLTHLLAQFLDHRDIAALVKKGDSNIGWITLDDVTETLMGARN